jgi:hypothetical protein
MNTAKFKFTWVYDGSPEISKVFDVSDIEDGCVKEFHDSLPSFMVTRFRQQCTNKKDLNGNEICEGDIVRWGHLPNSIELSGTRVALVSLSPALQFEAVKPRKYTFEWGNFMYKSTHLYLEIIGNIYQNPELLESK